MLRLWFVAVDRNICEAEHHSRNLNGSGNIGYTHVVMSWRLLGVPIAE